MQTFMSACVASNATAENIDDYIRQWHEADTDLSVYEFLGMKRYEYELWLKDAPCLEYIIQLYKQFSLV